MNYLPNWLTYTIYVAIAVYAVFIVKLCYDLYKAIKSK